MPRRVGEAQFIREQAKMDHDGIVYQFSRSKVQRGDFSHFLSLYGADKLPTGRRLRDLMDRFVFCVEGWDHDPRESHDPGGSTILLSVPRCLAVLALFLQSAGGYAQSHDALLHAFRHNDVGGWSNAGEGDV
jgi:hypothetical protein